MEQSHPPITIVVNNQEMLVDQRFAEISGYIKGIAVLTATKKFNIQRITPQTLQRVIMFAELNDFKDFETPKVQSNNLREVMSEANVKFFEQMPNRQAIINLFEAALILDVKCLRECCASYFAALVYFKKHDLQSYEAVKNRLGIKAEFTPETSAELKRKYPLLLNQ